MRVLLAVHQFENPSAGGTEVYTRALAAQLAARNEVAVLFPAGAFADTPVLEQTRAGELTHYRLHGPAPADGFYDNWSGARFRKLIARAIALFKPDVVHVQHLSGMGVALLEEAKNFGARIVMTIPDYWAFCPRGQMIRDDLQNCERPDEARCSACAFGAPVLRAARSRLRSALGPLGRVLPEDGLASARNMTWLARAGAAIAPAGFAPIAPAREKIAERLEALSRAIDLIDLFIAPSQAIGRAYARLGVAPSKIRHLDYGFEELRLEERHVRAVTEPLRLGFLGTLIPSKGLHVVADALRLLRPGQVELHIWGEFVSYHGDESYRAELTRRLWGLAHENHGPIAHERVAEALSQVDALVVPSLWRENSPLVIHEAMQAGLPVVASRVGGIPELVRDGDTGFLYKASDPAELAEKLRILSSGYEFPHRENWTHLVESISDHARRVEALYLEGAQW
ncbi:MAG: glycosyltransferase [Chrysiogenetes bacterium]|nr:glycosyltransferase [Chrysiogenetes bacterium]